MQHHRNGQNRPEDVAYPRMLSTHPSPSLLLYTNFVCTLVVLVQERVCTRSLLLIIIIIIICISSLLIPWWISSVFRLPSTWPSSSSIGASTNFLHFARQCKKKKRRLSQHNWDETMATRRRTYLGTLKTRVVILLAKWWCSWIMMIYLSFCLVHK